MISWVIKISEIHVLQFQNSLWVVEHYIVDSIDAPKNKRHYKHSLQIYSMYNYAIKAWLTWWKVLMWQFTNVLQCCGNLLLDYLRSSQLLWYYILYEFRIDNCVIFHTCACEYSSTHVVATIKYMTRAIPATRKHGPYKHAMGKLGSYLVVPRMDTHVKMNL